MSPASDEDSAHNVPILLQQLQPQIPSLSFAGEGKKHVSSGNAVDGPGTQNNGIINNHNYQITCKEVSFGTDPEHPGLEENRKSESVWGPIPESQNISYQNHRARNLPLRVASRSSSPTVQTALDETSSFTEQGEQNSLPFIKYKAARPIIEALGGVLAHVRKARGRLKDAGMPDAHLSGKALQQRMLLYKIQTLHQEIQHSFQDVPEASSDGEEERLNDLLRNARGALYEARALERRVIDTVQMLGSGRRKPRPEALNHQLQLCRDVAKNIKKSLEEFKTLFSNFCTPADLDPNEAHVLNTMSASREASAVLCQRLSRLCPDQPAHQAYFSAGRDQDNKAHGGHVTFVFACQKTNAHLGDDNLVWIRAKSDILPYQVVPEEVGVLASQNDVKFCLAEVPQNFNFKIGESQLSCLASNNIGASCPLPLSEWIKAGKYRDRHTRISLARMIAEIVLNLNPNLWLPTCLKPTEVFVVTSGYETIESHIRIRLEQLGNDGNNHDRNSMQDQMTLPVEKVLLGLGLTLLELAYGEEIPPAEREAFISCPNGADAKHIRDKCYSDFLEEEMGRTYAAVTRLCLVESNSRGEMYDLETQRAFYQKVIRPLEMEEENAGGREINMLKKLARDIPSF
ncbi:hypothetical protein CEP53_002359 [Fusarium sp. AF-6]|nr:hypothetical protein CEP53_002359 [Fusarium sp. AF-6]